MPNRKQKQSTGTSASMDTKSMLAEGAKIKFWKPNLFQKLMYRIGLMKDPRYNGKKMDWVKYDEFGQWKS